MERLKYGDIIGIATPSWLAEEGIYRQITKEIEQIGFKVVLADKFYANGWGFAATPEERAEAIHSLVKNEEVKLIFFGGGEGGDDVIPYLDYELIAKYPKLWLSFSDGTSILNAIHSRAGLPVFYGCAPSDFYCEDFGHGNNHAIFEIGAKVRLDTIRGELLYQFE